MPPPGLPGDAYKGPWKDCKGGFQLIQVSLQLCSPLELLTVHRGLAGLGAITALWRPFGHLGGQAEKEEMPMRAARAGGAGWGTLGSRQPFGAAVWAVERGAAGPEGSWALGVKARAETRQGWACGKVKWSRERAGEGVALIIRKLHSVPRERGLGSEANLWVTGLPQACIGSQRP